MKSSGMKSLRDLLNTNKYMGTVIRPFSGTKILNLVGGYIVSERSSQTTSYGQIAKPDWLVGPSLTTYEKQWELMFVKLEKYYQQHRVCNIPQRYIQDPSHGNWVLKQRMDYSQLDSVRRTRLKMIGFVWDPLDQQWEAMFTKLEKYRQQHGDCLVPTEYKRDLSLGMWVSRQRKNVSRLDSIRRDRLDKIGFVWDPLDQQWEVMFAKLEEYRQQHGDCLVPKRYREDPSLGRWVSTQRNNYANLSSTRRHRLDSIGFVWDAKHARRSVS